MVEYSPYWSYLRTRVKEEYNFDLDTQDEALFGTGRFTVGQDRGVHRNMAIRAHIVEPMDPDIREQRDEHAERVKDALENDNPERAAELRDERPEPRRSYKARSHDVEYALPDDLAEDAREAMGSLRDATIAPDAHLNRIELVGYTDDSGETHTAVTSRITQKADPTGAFDALASAVAADHDRVPSAASVNSISVSVGPTDLDRDRSEDGEHGFDPHDYTIYFETPKPHEFWAGPDTFEEYKQKVVENNEDITMEDIADNETMPVHVHMQTGERADHIVEGVSQRRLNEAVRSDGFETTPTRISFDEATEVVRGTVTDHLDGS